MDVKAIEYLNNNPVWVKDSLENYDITKGLFDAMNTLNLDLLTGERYSTLKDKSSNFRFIVDAANVCRTDSVDVQGLINGGHYNSNPSDEQITISKYIKWLQDAPQKAKLKNNSTKGVKKSNIIDGKNKDSKSTQPAPPRKQDKSHIKV